MKFKVDDLVRYKKTGVLYVIKGYLMIQGLGYGYRYRRGLGLNEYADAKEEMEDRFELVDEEEALR